MLINFSFKIFASGRIDAVSKLFYLMLTFSPVFGISKALLYSPMFLKTSHLFQLCIHWVHVIIIHLETEAQQLLLYQQVGKNGTDNEGCSSFGCKTAKHQGPIKDLEKHRHDFSLSYVRHGVHTLHVHARIYISYT